MAHTDAITLETARYRPFQLWRWSLYQRPRHTMWQSHHRWQCCHRTRRLSVCLEQCPAVVVWRPHDCRPTATMTVTTQVTRHWFKLYQLYT